MCFKTFAKQELQKWLITHLMKTLGAIRYPKSRARFSLNLIPLKERRLHQPKERRLHQPKERRLHQPISIVGFLIVFLGYILAVFWGVTRRPK
jgi:hypothetical protein